MTNSASDGWVDETWRFSKEEENRILDALGIPRPKAKPALNAVLESSRLYLSFKASERQQASKSEIHLTLREIAERCDALRLSIHNLDEQSRDYLEEDFDSHISPKNSKHIMLNDLLCALDRLSVKARFFEPRGRPPEDALGVFGNQLAIIWERAHEKWPTRTYDAYKEKETGPFRRFIEACVKAVDPSIKCPDGLIRRVLKGRKTMEKNTRRSKPKPSRKRLKSK